MSKISLKVNGKLHTVELEPETPLLFALSDEIGLRGPKFGCGMAQVRGVHGDSTRSGRSILCDAIERCRPG